MNHEYSVKVNIDGRSSHIIVEASSARAAQNIVQSNYPNAHIISTSQVR